MLIILFPLSMLETNLIAIRTYREGIGRNGNIQIPGHVGKNHAYSTILGGDIFKPNIQKINPALAILFAGGQRISI